MFKKLIKFIMNITKFHKIPTGEKSNSKNVVFPKIGLYYYIGDKILLYRFSDDDGDFPLVAFSSNYDAPENTEVIFEGTYDSERELYVDNVRNKSIHDLKINIFKDDTSNMLFGDQNGEAISTLLDISPGMAISIAGRVDNRDENNYKFAAIMNGTSGYGYYSQG